MEVTHGRGYVYSIKHFIEMDKDQEGNLFLVIHSGSLHLGKEVTEYYLKEGHLFQLY